MMLIANRLVPSKIAVVAPSGTILGLDNTSEVNLKIPLEDRVQNPGVGS